MVGAHRFRQVIAEDNPTLMAFDQDAWTRNLDYARRKPKQSLETFRRIRAENYDLLKGLPETAFERAGNHTENGPMTLLRLLEGYAATPRPTPASCRKSARSSSGSKGRSDCGAGASACQPPVMPK